MCTIFVQIVLLLNVQILCVAISITTITMFVDIVNLFSALNMVCKHKWLVLTSNQSNELVKLVSIWYIFSKRRKETPPWNFSLLVQKLAFHLFATKRQFSENTKIYAFYFSSLNTEVAEELEIVHRRGKGPASIINSVQWLLMSWFLTWPGHQQPWYWNIAEYSGLNTRTFKPKPIYPCYHIVSFVDIDIVA